jgi:hypothetical protein
MDDYKEQELRENAGDVSKCYRQELAIAISNAKKAGDSELTSKLRQELKNAAFVKLSDIENQKMIIAEYPEEIKCLLADEIVDDGEYPSMCSGIVVVKINGQIEKFKYCLRPRIPAAITERKFEDYPGESYWVFDPVFNEPGPGMGPFISEVHTDKDRENYYFKKQAQKPMKESTRLEIEKIMNEYLPQRCCEGCE